MTRKYFVWFLIVAFLTLTVTPEVLYARSDKNPPPDYSDLFDEDKHEKDKTKAIVLVSLGTIALFAIIYLIVKNAKKSKVSEGLQEEDPDKLITSQGEVVVYRW